MAKAPKPPKKPVFKATPLRVALGMEGSDRTVAFDTLLFPKSIEQDTATVTGHLLTPQGMAVASIEIKGMPLEMLNQVKPPGRKTNHIKRLSVFLEWLMTTCQGSKRNEADVQVAKRFHYADPKQVRDLRASICEEYSLDPETLDVWTMAEVKDGHLASPDFACLYEVHERKPVGNGAFLDLRGYRWDGKTLGGERVTFTVLEGDTAQQVLSSDKRFITIIRSRTEREGE